MMNQSASAPAVTETNKKDDRGRPYNCGADVMHQKGLVHGQGFYQSIHAKTHQRRSPKSDVQSTKHHPTKELRHWCISKHDIKTPANQHKHGLSWFIPSLLSNPSSNSISNSYAATTTGFKQKGKLQVVNRKLLEQNGMFQRNIVLEGDRRVWNVPGKTLLSWSCQEGCGTSRNLPEVTGSFCGTPTRCTKPDKVRHWIVP